MVVVIVENVCVCVHLCLERERTTPTRTGILSLNREKTDETKKCIEKITFQTKKIETIKHMCCH